MTEIDQPAGEDGAAQQGGRWGIAVGAVALVCVALGFAAGMTQAGSIYYSSDPQWGFLIFLFGIPIGAFFGVVAVVIFLVGHVPRITGTIFLAILALMGGDMVAMVVRDSASRNAQAMEPLSSTSPVWLSANATVTVALADQRGYVAVDPGPMGDGRFGQWCTSEPDSLAVYELEADIGRLDGYRARIELWLTDPSGTFTQSGIPVPRIVVTATDDDGMVQYGQWTGRATKMAGDGTTGRARFNSLVLQGASPGLSPPPTLSGEVTWSCGSWQER